MCRDLTRSRRFYEEFLGLEVVRHARPAMMLRLNSGMYVVCVRVGELLPEQHVLTHWGLELATREDVDRAHAEASRCRERYGIVQIKAVRERHGAYGFYLQDLDRNWWEIQHDPRQIDEVFACGDIVEMDLAENDTGELEE